MAKLTLADIVGGFNTVATYNANNTLLEQAIENTLSRDGSTPNQMGADLDMNSKDVNNVGALKAQTLELAGSAVTTVAAATTIVGLTDTTITAPTLDQVLRYNGSTWVNVDLTVALPQYHRTIETNSSSTDPDNDVDFLPGQARSVGNTADINLTTTLTKQADVNWASGTGAGGFPSGLTRTADTWYYLFVISNGTDVDAGFDSSITATNLLADATGYTEYRLVGAVLMDSSNDITEYFQNGDTVHWVDNQDDHTNTDQFATAVLLTMSSPLGIKCPIGIAVRADGISVGIPYVCYISSPDATDAAAGTSNYSAEATAITRQNVHMEVTTDLLSQKRHRSNTLTVSSLSIHTKYWKLPPTV